MTDEKADKVELEDLIKSFSIEEKLFNVFSEITYAKKESTLKGFNGYKYVGGDQVSELFRKSFIKNRILFYSSMENQDIAFNFTTKNGSEYHVTQIVVKCRFINVDKPSEFIEFLCQGQGADIMEKGPFKAVTGAVRHGLLKFFLIPTGDADPEQTEEAVNKGNAEKDKPDPVSPKKKTDALPKKEESEYTKFLNNMVKAKKILPVDKYKSILGFEGFSSSRDVNTQKLRDSITVQMRQAIIEMKGGKE